MDRFDEDRAGAPPPHERIRLHFFDSDEERSLRSRWDRLAVRTEQPSAAEIPDALIPLYTRAYMARSAELTCVFDRENHPVPESLRLRGEGDAPDTASPEPGALEGFERDGRAAFFLGVNARHYGHFLLETLSRAWAWEPSRHDVAVITSPPILDFARSLSGLIPGLAERMEVIERTTRFRLATVPSPAFSISRETSLAFKKLCEGMAGRAQCPARATEQPVYLSRARLRPGSSRALIGELRLEQLLESEGFRIAHPETLPIAQQIALVNAHKWIVAPMGSACHTRLFSRTGNNLLMLASGHVHPNYVLCDLLSPGETHYAKVFCSPISGERIPTSLKPLMADDDRVLRILKELGLIRQTARFADSTDLTGEMQRSVKRAKRRAKARAKRSEK